MDDERKMTPLEMIQKAIADSSSNPYAAKFKDQKEQFGALAALLAGVPVRIVALVFGINKTTASTMLSGKHGTYQPGQREVIRMGKDEFIRTYLTPEIANRINAFVQQHSDLRQQPDPRRSRRRGFHRFRIHGSEVAFSIEWLTAHGKTGWFLVHPKSNAPTGIEDEEEEGGWRPFRSSDEAYEYIKNEGWDFFTVEE